MMLRTVVRDCLFLNWALPVEALPEPPPPLRYQLHTWHSEEVVFASAVLFRQEGLHFDGLPLPRLSYPQLNLRLYVLDGEGIPSVLFRRMLMPGWVLPGAKLLTHQPVAAARLDFPRPSRDGGGGDWTWRVARHGRLEVRVQPGSPQLGTGPRLGTWEETVEYFQERPRGYVEQEGGGLHRIAADHSPPVVWPVRAEIGKADLLPALLPLADGHAWPSLHSCWLCPEIPFAFELELVPRMAMAAGVPRPAATSGGAARARRQFPAAARSGEERQPAPGLPADLPPGPPSRVAPRSRPALPARSPRPAVQEPVEVGHGV